MADLLSMMSPVEREYHFQVEREKADKARIAELEAAREAEAARKEEEWAETMKEVAGKTWTVDFEGNVIIVEPPNADKDLAKHPMPVKTLVKAASPPPDELPPGTTMPAPAAAAAAAAGATAAATTATEATEAAAAVAEQASGGRKSPKSGTIGSGKSRDGGHFTKSTELQPVMTQNRRFLPEVSATGEKLAGRLSWPFRMTPMDCAALLFGECDGLMRTGCMPSRL